MNKPVEVWCVVRPDGMPLCHNKDADAAWAEMCQSVKQSQAYLERYGYRCERRLLVPVGQTFADGVEAAFLQIHNAINAAEQGQDVGVALAALDLITALSPAPEPTKDEATELLREIGRIWRPAAGEYDNLLERIDTYLNHNQGEQK